jgi:energy-coupling factor transport system permease protein
MRALFAPRRGGGFPARLDARTKMLLCLVASLTSIVLTDMAALGVLLAASAAYALSARDVKGLLVSYAAVALMLGTSALCVVGMGLLWPSMASLEPRRFIVPFMRILVSINVILGLALTSRVQSILTALKSLKLPPLVFIPASVMVRFIPTFIGDIRQIWQTLRIRGYARSPLALAAHPGTTLRVLFMPIVFRALRSADDLAMAAELKGVGGQGRVTAHRLGRMAARDYLSLAAGAGLVALAIWLQLRSGLRLSMH